MGKLGKAKDATINYFKGVYHEMQKVVWPTRRKALTDSITVIIFSFVVAALLAGCDFIFAAGVEKLIDVFHK